MFLRNHDAYEHKISNGIFMHRSAPNIGEIMFLMSNVIGMLYVMAVINLVIGVMNVEENHFNLMETPTPPPTTKL